MSARSNWVDHAKGIGIILVVYAHVARGIHSAGLPMDERIFRLVDSVIYSFHMPLFFFLSGLFFVGSLQRQGGARLIAGRFDTIVYPYVVWSLIQGTIEVFLSQFTNGKVAAGEVAALLWQPRAQFWFLYAMFFTFLAATLIYRRLDGRWQFAVALAAISVSLVRDVLPAGIPLNFLYQYFIFFALGVSAAPSVPRLAGGTGRFALILIPSFAITQFAVHGALGLDYATADKPLALALAVVSISAIVVASLLIERKGPALLAQIGRASLGIYLMHILAGSGVRVVLHKLLGIDSAALHLAAGALAGVGLPMLTLRIVNRYGLGCLLAPPQSLSLTALAGRWWSVRQSMTSRN